jgi:hypothetical protein
MTERPARQRNTFAELYCRANRCLPEDFPTQLFWESLHRHALPFAPFILLFNSKYFDADRKLIDEVSRAEKLDVVWEAVRDFFVNPRHTGWLRRRANIRISGRRLTRIARLYLPISGTPPPPYPPTKA